MLLANLGCDLELAALCARRRGGAAPSAQPVALQRALAAMGSLLRAAAAPGDLLWLPHDLDEERIPPVSALPRPSVTSELPARAAAALAWGETPEVARWRRQAVGSPAPARADRTRTDDRGELALRDTTTALWRCPPADAELVRRVNHRGFQLQLARDLELALPSAAIVDDEPQLSELVAAGSGPWVLKAVHSAAARRRLIVLDPPLSAAQQVHATRLLQQGGQLLCEPWHERIVDFGCCLLVESGGARYLGSHELLVDWQGNFRGIAIAANGCAGLRASESDTVAAAAQEVGDRLHQLGYRGPAGIDGYVHRDRSGLRRLRALAEINGRMTFGLIARLLAQRLADPGAAERCALRVQRVTADPPASATVTRIPLLDPAEDDPTRAWIDLDRPTSA